MDMFNADDVFLWLIYATWPGVTAYASLYAFRSPWWKTAIGRALLIKAIGLSLLMSFVILIDWFGRDYWGRDIFRIGGMIFTCVGIWYALVNLISIQNLSKRERRELGGRKLGKDRRND